MVQQLAAAATAAAALPAEGRRPALSNPGQVVEEAEAVGQAQTGEVAQRHPKPP